MPDRYCQQCGEALQADEEGFHRTDRIDMQAPTWYACLLACTGDSERIIRVHNKLRVDINPPRELR